MDVDLSPKLASMELTEEHCDALVKRAHTSLGSRGFEIHPFKVRKTDVCILIYKLRGI